VSERAKSNSMLRVGAIGTVVTAICCFTPILAWPLAALGMGAMVGVLDYVLWPSLALFAALALYGLFRKRPADG